MPRLPCDRRLDGGRRDSPPGAGTEDLLSVIEIRQERGARSTSPRLVQSVRAPMGETSGSDS